MGPNFSSVAGTLDELKTRCAEACEKNDRCEYASMYYASTATCYLHDNGCGDYENNRHGSYHTYFKPASAVVTPAPVGGAGGGGGSVSGGGGECAGKTNLSPGVYIRLNKLRARPLYKATLEQKTKLVDDDADPICECHDLCKEKSADAFMYYTRGKKKTKAICKCYMDLVAANEGGKLKLQIGGKRTTGKNTGWITDAGKNLIAGDNAKDTKRRIKERKQSKKRRRGRRN